MAEDKKLVRQHFNKLGKIGCAITGANTSVICLEPKDPAVGYTKSPERSRIKIYLNPYHSLFESIENDRVACLTGVDGVFYHECFHQLFTNFRDHEYFIKCLERGNFKIVKSWCQQYDVDVSDVPEKEYPQAEISLFHQIWNAIEDPSIEYWGLRKYAGEVMRCLRYIIARTYAMTDNVDSGETPFRQVMVALIQFGDLGVIKGRFTFNEAREAFLKVAPTIDKAITSPDATERIVLAFRVFEDLRPLWETDMKAQEEFMKAFKEWLKSMGLEESSGSGKGEFSSNADDASAADNEEAGEGASSRRMKTIEMTRKEFEELKKKSSGSGGSGETVKVKIIDEDGEDGKDGEESKDGKDGKSKSKKKSGKSKKDKSDEKGEDGKSGESSEAGSDGEGSTEGESSDGEAKDGAEASSEKAENAESTSDSSEASGEQPHDWTPTATEMEDLSDDPGIEELLEEMGLSEEDYREIEASIEKELSESELETQDKDTKIPDFDISGRGYKTASCKNVLVKPEVEELEDSYNQLVEQISGSINKLAETFKRASKKDRVNVVKKTTGKLNVGRYAKLEAKPTVRLFDKRRNPGDNDLAVMVSVDESGSMWGDRTAAARLSAIGIAEACAKAKIPLYIMGFTADIGGYKAYHLHYVRWHNTRRERISLTSIKARDNNFDGYSVRYATKLLLERPEKHKLLIVISDGQPACSSYRDYSTGGIADTKDAVRQATNAGVTVQGISIGGSDVKVLHEIYGLNFVANNNLQGLMQDLGKSILKQLKKAGN